MKILTMADFIELNTFLKLKLNLPTGGQAKLLIRSGKVFVNGQLETRNRKKLVKGEIVSVESKRWEVG